MAIFGIILNSIDLKKFKLFSMICYLAMGWCIIVKINLVIAALGWTGFTLLVAGGIIYTIGAGYGSNFSIDDCEYSKVIIMSDADEDGGHIQCLLLTFFYRYMKPLIEDGRLFVALPPLFKIQSGKNIDYAYTIEEMKEKSKGKKCEIQRYKGLGEMNADQLCETTMQKGTRTLIRVNIEDAQLAEKRVSVLMGDDVPPRKEWIDENVEFTLEDEYQI